MKFFFVFLMICFFYYPYVLAQKEGSRNETGLSMNHLHVYAPKPIVSKVHKAHLYLPKVNDPLVKVQQNGWLSQNFYYQSSPKPTWSDHNRLMNQQLLVGNHPRDLFVERLIDMAIGKLFGLD